MESSQVKLTQNVDLDDVVLILVAVVHYSLTYMIDQMCAEYYSFLQNELSVILVN